MEEHEINVEEEAPKWATRVWRGTNKFLKTLWPSTAREHCYFWLLMLPLVIFIFLWRFSIAPMATVWGDIGTWVAGLATLAGLVYASLSLRAQIQQRKDELIQRRRDEEERREAQARAISVTSNWIPRKDSARCKTMRIELEIINASPLPIDTVVLEYPIPNHHEEDGWGTASRIVGTLLPGSTFKWESEYYKGLDIPFGLLFDFAQVRFTDTWGTHWLRGPGHIEIMTMPPMTC